MSTMVSQSAEKRTLSVHKEHEFLLKLETAGLSDDLAQRVIDSPDNDLAVKLVRLIENGGFESTTSQKRAREIMDRNCFGIEEAIKHLGVNPSRSQLAALAEVPWSEEVLTACKDTHVLIAVFTLSILEVRGKVKDKASLFYGQDWFNKEAFASDRGEASWQLVRKTPVPNSTNKTWDQQQTLLTESETTPSARVMVYTIIGHYMATRERLFECIYVRCSDVDSDDNRVRVGYFGSRGLCVDSDSDDARIDILGVSSARKFIRLRYRFSEF